MASQLEVINANILMYVLSLFSLHDAKNYMLNSSGSNSSYV